MSRTRIQLSACALAATAFLAACGGGGTTPDTTAPTVTITDNITGTATSDVTFSFTFNEAVTGFTTDDVSVNNGTKGAFTMAANGLSASLVVTPPSTGSGSIEVSVAAGTFADASNNANTATASASQAFGAPAPAAFISFDEDPGITGELQAYGGALPDLVTGPSGGSGKTLKITKPAGSGNQVWGGSFFTVPSVPFTASKKAITARVYSTVPNAVILMKVEQPNGTNPCNACTEVAGTTVTEANTWTTVTWDFSAALLTRNHTVLAITPDATRALDGATYYIDQLNVVDTPAGQLQFASGYSAINPATVDYAYQGQTTEGGNFNWTVANAGTYGWNGPDFWWHEILGSASTPHFKWGGKGKADQAYMESWVNAPSNGTLSLSGQTKLRMAVWGNNELIGAPRFTPVIQLADVNGCYPRAEAAPLTPAAIGPATYNINLSDFSVIENCGTAMTTAEFMNRPIGSIRVRIYKANYFNPNGNYDSANGIDLGPISFQP